MRVLVVEDDAPLASFVRKGLEAEHYAVDVAPDGEQARHMALESDYDLLVLDLNQAATNLANAETARNAALQATASIGNLSLFDYLGTRSSG